MKRLALTLGLLGCWLVVGSSFRLAMSSKPRRMSPGKTRKNKTAAPADGVARLRVNKVLFDICSRREADRLVEQGRVRVNGRVAKHGDLVGPKDSVTLHGRKVKFPKAAVSSQHVGQVNNELVYLLYHKPKGVVCTTDPNIRGNVVDEIGHAKRLFPVGRLDKDTTGALLLTSDGRLPNAILRSEHKKPKVYEVLVDRKVSPRDVDRLANGVVIRTVAQRDRTSKVLVAPTKPCRVEQLAPRMLRVTLTEGRNRQVRKMLAAVGYKVVKLHRTSVMGIRCDGIPCGNWRPLNKAEMRLVKTALEEQAMCLAPTSSDRGATLKHSSSLQESDQLEDFWDGGRTASETHMHRGCRYVEVDARGPSWY